MRITGQGRAWTSTQATNARRWWRARNRRERILLATFAVILSVAILVGLVIRPLQAARAEALAALRTDDAIQNRILAAGPVSAAPAVRRSGEMSAIVAASAPAFGLTIQSIHSTGARTEMHIASARYDDLIRWLADLARTTDARVDRIAILRDTAPGTVTVELVVSR